MWGWILSGLLLFGALPTWAHAEEIVRNRVSFQVETRREVANDWATARFAVQAEGKDLARIAQTVNTRMAGALARARKTKGIELRSGAYVTQPVYEDGRVVRWRARQEFRAETRDVDRLAKLIGRLQGESVLLVGVDFSIRPETRMAVEDELIQEALSAFRARASLIARGLEASGWSLVSLSVGRHGVPFRRMEMMRGEASVSAFDAVPPPAFEAGSSDIRVQISGSVELD